MYNTCMKLQIFREAARKCNLGGDGGKGRTIKEKRTFKNLFFSAAKVPTAIKLEGGGVKALIALPLKKNRTFLWLNCL